MSNIEKLINICQEQGAVIALRQGFHRFISSPRFLKELKSRNQKKRVIERIRNPEVSIKLDAFLSKGLFRNPSKVRCDIQRIPENEKKKILKDADKILMNRYPLYPGVFNDNSDNFSWLRDPLSGYIWPKTVASRSVAFQKPIGTDIKNIWELSRFQFMRQLCSAYILTEKEKYVDHIRHIIISWLAENSFPSGPNWARAMEAAIRLINISLYLPLINYKKKCSQNEWNCLIEFFVKHIVYIEENLEKSPAHTNNHYLSNLVGLLLSGVVFKKIKWAEKNFTFAEKSIYEEISKQFRSGGLNYEGSLPYHRFSCEIVLIGLLLIKQRHRHIPDSILRQLQKSSELNNSICSISNSIPVIGDNDSGLFLSFFNGQSEMGLRYISVLYKILNSEELLPDSVIDYFLMMHFVDSDISQIKENTSGITNVKTPGVMNYDGLVIASDNEVGIYFNTIANGLYGSGGHTHNDKLSFFPFIKQVPLFVDPGSYSYSGYPDKRYNDQQTKNHNGPAINAWEQNSLFRKDIFRIGGEASCEAEIKQTTDSIEIIGWHDGYMRFNPGLRTFRKITWNYSNDRSIIIEDFVESSSQDALSFSWNFLIPGMWSVELNKSQVKMYNERSEVRFMIPSSVSVRLSSSHYSPGYQYEEICYRLELKGFFKAGDIIRFQLTY